MTIDPATIDGQIHEILEQMSFEEPYTDKYAQMTDQLVKLHSLKTPEKGFRVNPDTAVMVAGNLASILLVLNYERANVIATKAFGFIRPKI